MAATARTIRFCRASPNSNIGVLRKGIPVRLPAKLSRKWSQQFIIALITLTLCGCLHDQRRQIFACKYQFLHTKPEHESLVTTAARNSIAICMETNGYIENRPDSNCEPKTALSPHCYAPRDQLAFIGYKAELLVQHR